MLCIQRGEGVGQNWVYFVACIPYTVGLFFFFFFFLCPYFLCLIDHSLLLILRTTCCSRNTIRSKFKYLVNEICSIQIVDTSQARFRFW